MYASARDAARRGPRPLRRHVGHGRRLDQLADEPIALGDDGRRSAVGVGPSLLEDSERHRVERAGLDVVAQPQATQSSAQLAGGLAGERQRQGVTGVGGAVGDAIGDATGEHAGLAGARRGDDRDSVEGVTTAARSALVEIGQQGLRVHRRHAIGRAATDSAGTGAAASAGARSRGAAAASGILPTMPYPKKLLNDYEELAVDLHPHWWYFAEAVAALWWSPSPSASSWWPSVLRTG